MLPFQFDSQGLNRLVAVALLYLTEEESFWSVAVFSLSVFVVIVCFGFQGCRDGVLAPYQCGPGSIRRLGAICGLSLLVLYSAPRGFSPGNPVFLSPQKPTFDLICINC